MADLGAWHGDPALKERIVARMKQHREADAFVHGLYQRLDSKLALGYKGCAIGCALDPQEPDSIGEGRRPYGGWWAEVERQFGIPEDVAEMIDDNFECLGRPDDANFAVEVLEAVPVGADLSSVSDAYWADESALESDRLLVKLVSEAPVRREVTSDAR
jgi:hypothetical protein